MEFLIGREVTGSNDIVVPKEYKSVSRVHAKITVDEKGILLQDLDSANGTFVDDEAVIQKKIDPTHKVVLSRQTPYEVDLNSIINNYNAFVNENKTDYTAEFDALETVYHEYQKSKNAIEDKPKKIIAIALFGLIVINICLHVVGNEYASYTTGLSVVVTSLSVFFIPKKKIKEKLSDLRLLYRSLYSCPKCRMRLNLEVSWKEYKADEKCPKCGAIYSK